MSSLIDEHLGGGLRILLLGSYDPETHDLLARLRKSLTSEFERYACTTLLAESIEAYVSRRLENSDFIVLLERQNSGGTAYIYRSYVPVSIFDFKNHEALLDLTRQLIPLHEMRQKSPLEKITDLAEWADIILVVKERELTRGGELLEVAWLTWRVLSRQQLALPRRASIGFPFNCFMLRRNGIPLSSIFSEILGATGIRPETYESYEELEALAISHVDMQIGRLNQLLGRFRPFES